ncbi:MAG: DNA polymerase III subunit delta' [Pseudomonadota bacterium]
MADEELPWPTPAAQPHLYGHDQAIHGFRQAVDGGRLHHAWLITGPVGLGKATLVYRFARYLLAGQGGAEDLSVDMDSPAVQRVIAGSHGDLLTVERGFNEKTGKARTELPVEAVRRIAPFLQSTASEGGWRIVILDDADTMNRSSQNALLKVLEEPPSKALLLLISDHPERLLATIRSRCRQLPLEPLELEPLIEAVTKLSNGEIDRSTITRLAPLAGFAPGQVLQLWHADVPAMLDDFEASLSPDAHDIRQRLAISLGQDQAKWRYFEAIAKGWLHSRIKSQQHGQASLDPVFALWDKTGRSLSDAEVRSLDRRLAALMLLETLSAHAAAA